MKVQVHASKAQGTVSIVPANDDDVPGPALGTKNTEISKILPLPLRSLEYFRGSWVNKKEQNTTGIIGKLYRIWGMEYIGQCGEYGLGVGRDALRKDPGAES